MNIEIRVSNRALESMVLSASESYVLGDGHRISIKKSHQNYKETYGHIWGIRKINKNSTEYIYVDRFYESLSARRKRDSVEPNEDAVRLKNSILERWSPHLSFLGDFHTHPYESLKEVQKCKGWEFSRSDRISFKLDDRLWELANHRPIMLVMVVAPIEKVRDTIAESQESNCWRFNIGELRFWLTASVGYIRKSRSTVSSINSKRSPSPLLTLLRRRLFRRDKIFLDLDPRFYYNPSGDRLSGTDNLKSA